ncbi:cell division cycle-associated protein 2 isoform X2 [Heterodontus francisci]
MGSDVARNYCQLTMCKYNEVILKSQNFASPASLNGNFVSDGNLLKPCDMTIFNDSVRFENQDSETITSLFVKDVAAQEDLELQVSQSKNKRRARRNVPGKSKARVDPLCEISVSSVENTARSTKQKSCRPLLQVNNSLHYPRTFEEKETIKVKHLVKCQSRTQQVSIHQEGTDGMSKIAELQMPRTASFELDFQSKDLSWTDGLPWRPVALGHQGSAVQIVGTDSEGTACFPVTPGDCATASKLAGENIANKQQDHLIVHKEQSSAIASFIGKTPSTPQGPSMCTESQLGIAAEMFNLKSAGKFSEARNRFSRRASSVGARGSPETNSLICYIAKQRMQPQESKRASMLKSKMAGFMDTFQVSEQDESKMATSDLQQAGTTPAAQRDCILSPSDSKQSLKKKVTFGGELSPELFDKRLPSNTPLRKGETPVCQKIFFSQGAPSALKPRSKVPLILEDKMIDSNNDSSPVNDHCNNTSLKLLRKLPDTMENGTAGTHNVGERCCPKPIKIEFLSPLSECAFESNLEKYDRNDECEVLEMKVQELKKELLDTISPSGFPGQSSEAGDDNITVRNVMTPKKTESITKMLKLSTISTESDTCSAAISDLESSRMKAASIVESDVQHMTCMLDEMLKNGDRQDSDLSIKESISDQKQANSCIEDMCPGIQNLNDQQRHETEDKIKCIESLSIEVSPTPIIISKEEVKTRNQERESKKEEPRRSTRIKSKVKNISKNSTTVTKGKCRQKFKKELYGKREYASRKPLLSPIAEILDIWSESADSPDCDGMLECEPLRRTSRVYLEGTVIGGESSQSMLKSECSADGRAALYAVSKSGRKKIRRPGRPRKRRIHYLQEEQNIQTSVENETQKGTDGNVGDHRYVPKKLNNLRYCLISGHDESSNVASENTEDRAFEVKALESSSGENVVSDHNKPTIMRRKSSKQVERKHLCEEFAMANNNQQGLTGVQMLFEGQCPPGTRLEECIKERTQTGDCNCLCSFLEPKSNFVEDIDKQLQTEQDEKEELSPLRKCTLTEESEVVSNEPLRAVPDEKGCISPPDSGEVFRSRPSRRNSQLFNAAELLCEKQPDQAAVVKVGGQHMIDANGDNRAKGDNVTQRDNENERFSDMVIKPFVFSQKNCVDEGGEAQVKTYYKILLNNFGHCCSLEQINSNMLEAADQFEPRINYSNVVLDNSLLEKKKVRRSARLSGFVNMEGLRWIEITSPEQLEVKNKSCKLTRRSFRLTEPWGKVSSTEEVERKTASQSRIRMLRRRSLSCNRNIAIDDLEEPPQKKIILE